MPSHPSDETWDVICENEHAALYLVEKTHSSGSVRTFYRGRSFITADDGSVMDTPEDETFNNEVEGFAWFAERTRNPIGKHKE